MENPLSSSDSQSPGLNEPTKDNTSPDVKEPVKFNTPEIIIEPERGPSETNEQSESSRPQDLNEPHQFSKPQIIIEPAEESRPQGHNEEAKDSKPQDQPTQNHKHEDLKEPDEDSKTPDQSQSAQASTAQDLKQAEMPPGKGITMSHDSPALEHSLDDRAQDPAEKVSEPKAQPIKAPVVVVVEEPEQQPQDKKVVAPPQILINGVQEETVTKKDKMSSTMELGRSSGPSGRSALPSKSPRRPPQLLKATLRPKPKPKTVDKATQILPGRVPMLRKIPPKTLLPCKPRPPHADKGTEISPSFEKLLKRCPPLVKKKKKEQLSPVSSHHSRLPYEAAGSAPRRVKSARSPSRHEKRATHVKRAKSVPVHAKSMPLHVKLSSSSPSKHKLNLSLCSRQKRKIICNLYLTFCENWEENQPCRSQRTKWEESLVSCSGLYRACSVFSLIKCGRIHVSNLLLAVHTLGILVTSEEMHCILHLVNVDEQKSLNVCEFLEAVNTVSPFAETEDFQNTLQAFKRMKKGTVTVTELEPILLYLGIFLSPESVQQALRRTKVNKNGKFDISDFLLAAKDLQRVLDEEDEAFLNECSVYKRGLFQDVADLVDAECRRRIKYWDVFEEEASTPLRRSFIKGQGTAEDADRRKHSSKTSNLDLRTSITAVPISMSKEETNDADSMEVNTSRLGLSSDLKSLSPQSSRSDINEENEDDAGEREESQLDLPSQDIQEPVPS